ncbi:MAG: 2-C-methyl-D-erythritol 4-phosphate cytidylyltransferase [Simkaniaceae bacterium]|nr:2-C-methyl-D-erythritol 4-phosphate cytidylyltransferase [Candidatus Sacchlamyda saccharinae]
MKITVKIPSILTSIPTFYILTQMKGVKGILLMAGQGARFGQPLPKQFHLLQGTQVYLLALEQLIESELFEEIILVTNEKQADSVQKEVGNTARVVIGGQTRQESSYRGLLACSSDTEIVLIHDGVRPFVSKRILQDNIRIARKHGSANTCIPSSDTIVYAPTQTKVQSIPPRSHYMRGQTPQTFSYPLILKAHQQTTKTNATDDCQLLLEMGHEITIVNGEEENRKITVPQDLLHTPS